MTRLLIVDDDEGLLRMRARALRRYGFEVTTASSGEAALDAVAAMVPDVVVSDVRMPSIDGPTLLRYLRSSGVLVPVVFVTGFASHSDDGLMALGASAVLGKPFDIGDLVGLLQTLTTPQPLSLP